MSTLRQNTSPALNYCIDLFVIEKCNFMSTFRYTLRWVQDKDKTSLNEVTRDQFWNYQHLAVGIHKDGRTVYCVIFLL